VRVMSLATDRAVARLIRQLDHHLERDCPAWWWRLTPEQASMIARPHYGPPRETGSISDEAFFRENPGRNYRLRLATQDEAARFEQHCGPAPRDWFVYTATKQFFPGMRVRKYFAGLLTGSLGEARAKEIFDGLAENDP
jgi:hypothetical protein